MSENKKYAAVLTASKSETILAVIEGLPVDANGYFLNETQMDGIDAALVAAENSATALQTATSERAQALAAHETALTNLDAANTRIAELEAEVKTLGKKDAGKASATGDDADPENGAAKTGWDKFHTSYDDEMKRMNALKNS